MKQYNENDLIIIAKRRNNAKRSYLLVNPLQAKHMAVSPTKAAELMKTLGELLKEAYGKEKLLIIGFAETATAISAYAAAQLPDCRYVQTTRESMSDCGGYFYFSEEHSHATEQKLCIDGLADILPQIQRMVFIDDEISTGKTIINIVSLMRKKLLESGVKITAASLINRMSDEDLRRFSDNKIEVKCLLKIPNRSYEECISDINGNLKLINDCRHDSGKESEHFEIRCSINPRKACGISEYILQCDKALDGFVNSFSPVGKTLAVLGTEECMYPAVRLGERLEQIFSDTEIKSFSTTRSPILVSDKEGYPIQKCAVLDSFYENGRKTFLYNILNYDEVIMLTDSEIDTVKAENCIKNAFSECKKITFVRIKKERQP